MPKPKHILIVEDDLDDQMLLRMVTEELKLPCRLHFFDRGEALLDCLSRWESENPRAIPPALMLLDLNLPGLSGHQVLKALRSDPKWKTLPVVVLTTSSNCRDIEVSYELGAQGHFVKPGGYAELRKTIQVIYTYWLETAAPVHGSG